MKRRARDAFLARASRAARSALDVVGFFHTFGFAACVVLAFELYLASEFGTHLFHRALPWRLLVGYVSSNHALYGLHTALGSGRCLSPSVHRPGSRSADGAGLLMHSSSRAWLRAAFDEHRLWA